MNNDTNGNIPTLYQQFLMRLNNGRAAIYCSGNGYRQCGFPCNIDGSDVYLNNDNGELEGICFDAQTIVPLGEEFDIYTPYQMTIHENPSKRYLVLSKLINRPHSIHFAGNGYMLSGTLRAVSPDGNYFILETDHYGNLCHVLVFPGSYLKGNLCE